MYKPLTDWFQKHLGREVVKVQVTNKLTDDPVFILTSQYGYSAAMEKINKAQAFANQEKAANYMLAKKTLELNPHHPLIKELLKRVKEAGDEGIDQDTVDTADLMYNMALLNSGFLIDDPSEFTDPLHKMLKVNLGLDRYAPVEQIEIDVSEDEEEEEEDNELLRVKDKKGTIEIESLDDEEETQYMHIHDDL
jgi:heat shock protein beta